METCISSLTNLHAAAAQLLASTVCTATAAAANTTTASHPHSRPFFCTSAHPIGEEEPLHLQHFTGKHEPSTTPVHPTLHLANAPGPDLHEHSTILHAPAAATRPSSIYFDADLPER
ncbi:hypothetical protein DEO72_LG11g1958 [Vigna unguiculata]|uniref:Secreted protein n=1 Tax=Vigna unguiculata TaxID=3917 RepID=A0A4D6NPT3_VIGUN|nr:hypothetical protein DEO72_LG11g1958 [Vigna unguiculata]